MAESRMDIRLNVGPLPRMPIDDDPAAYRERGLELAGIGGGDAAGILGDLASEYRGALDGIAALTASGRTHSDAAHGHDDRGKRACVPR